MADDSKWPKHPDGRNKKMGEMTKEERREQFRASTVRVLTGMGATEIKDETHV